MTIDEFDKLRHTYVKIENIIKECMNDCCYKEAALAKLEMSFNLIMKALDEQGYDK